MNIDSAVIYHEPFIRIVFFAAIFAIVAIAELFSPRRKLVASKQQRWINNILLNITSTIILRLVFPILPVGIALFCSEKEWGIMNYFQIPLWVAVICGVVLLDLTIYAQHKMFHFVPVFWRLHKVHHIDQDIDVTTGLRFHPLEMILSMIIKITAVAAIGAPAVSVVIFEILLNGTTMFNHGNLNISLDADRIIRLLIVTPDMHRVHHSVIVKETNSNYGFNFSWWDRIFRTYRPQPENGHLQMKIGLTGYHESKYLKLSQMLIIPFRNAQGILR
jgi:sterol desaturase/sphingolipid hydroxylase (fatty acid hydroxylase superfamily)